MAAPSKVKTKQHNKDKVGRGPTCLFLEVPHSQNSKKAKGDKRASFHCCAIRVTCTSKDGALPGNLPQKKKFQKITCRHEGEVGRVFEHVPAGVHDLPLRQLCPVQVNLLGDNTKEIPEYLGRFVSATG